MDDIKRKELEALVKELDGMRGRHTEFVTVYVPAGFDLNKVVQQLRSEQGTAENIKSKATRKAVTGSLERILQHLKTFKGTPPNGLAVFCGNVGGEGSEDLQLWSLEPPEPLNQRLYWCGQTFVLDPLKELVREKEVYGLILVDKGDAAIGLMVGKRVKLLKQFDSLVLGKTRKGGWSANRYARVREGLLEDHLKKVGEIASGFFKEQKDLIGVIIGGPGPIKEQFVNSEYLEYTVKAKVLGTVNTAYTGEEGLEEMIGRSEELLREAKGMKERKVLERFFEELAKDGLAVYGIVETVRALRSGSLELLLLSEKFDWEEVKGTCTSCGHAETHLVRKGEKALCPKCEAPVAVAERIDLEQNILKSAEQMGTRVELVSVESPKGEQLYALGGIGGILRYKA